MLRANKIKKELQWFTLLKLFLLKTLCVVYYRVGLALSYLLQFCSALYVPYQYFLEYSLCINRKYNLNIWENTKMKYLAPLNGVYVNSLDRVKEELVFLKEKKESMVRIESLQGIELLNLQAILKSTKEEDEQIIAITVSTNYHDTLALCIEQNYKFFKKWYIITCVNDNLTQEICKKYNNVVVLFFKFKDGTATFNKGGALLMAQTYLHRIHPRNFMLVIDSDIYLPSNFTNIIKGVDLQKDIIYGAPRRLHKSIESFQKQVEGRMGGEEFMGFFQLYKGEYYYTGSYDAAWCDIRFSELFKNTKVIDALLVEHIGEIGVNWSGKLPK